MLSLKRIAFSCLVGLPYTTAAAAATTTTIIIIIIISF